MKQPPGRITPLWIIAAFVSMTEATLGYALTKTADGVQIALTVFVILFAVLVAAAFFLILWHRPFVFYSPSEYGDIDPRSFIDAIKKSVSPRVAEQLQLVREIERNPKNQDAQFGIVNSLLDEVYRQHLILMSEQNVDIPYSDMFSHKYSLGTKNQHLGNGMFQSGDFVKKLEGTKFVELIQDQGIKIRITDEGRAYAKWLVGKGKKADFIDTPLGKWGEPFTFGDGTKGTPEKPVTQIGEQSPAAYPEGRADAPSGSAEA